MCFCAVARPALSPNQKPCRFARQRLCYGISDNSLACEALPPAHITNDRILLANSEVPYFVCHTCLL